MKYTVNSLSKLLNISSMTIRRYAEMGYITPEKNEKNNYTYYDSRDIDTIVRVRMYRKYGFSHDEIKEMLNSPVGIIADVFENKLIAMDKELEKLKALRHRVKDNLIMIKRIGEFEKGYILQPTEPTYYFIYQIKDEILMDKERFKAIEEFMDNIPEIKEITVFKKENIDNDNYECALGFSAKERHIKENNIDVSSKYFTFQPEQECVYFLLKTYKDDIAYQEENKKIKKDKFDKAKLYLKEQGFILNRDILGFNITSAMEEGIEMLYTLICVPFERK